MKSMQLTSRVGKDGILKIQMPVDITDQEVDVVVVVQPRLKFKPGADMPEVRGWLPGFFEKTAGAWQGDPLTRPPQGKYEIREELK